MPTEKQLLRRKRIEDAAYEILREEGYKAASLLSIAKRAPASNETLYKWYGNKQGLFRSLVEQSAQQTKTILEDALSDGADALDTLANIGPILLGMVTSERAICLNRAAAGDVHDTGTLGEALAQAGRETIAPILAQLLQAGKDAGQLTFEDTKDTAETYIQLLIGDLQIRRVIGVIPELSRAEIAKRAARALTLFSKLYSPEHTKD